MTDVQARCDVVFFSEFPDNVTQYVLNTMTLDVEVTALSEFELESLVVTVNESQPVRIDDDDTQPSDLPAESIKVYKLPLHVGPSMSEQLQLLPGLNVLDVVADVSKAGEVKSCTKSLLVYAGDPGPQALVIGISDYIELDGNDDLRWARRDAEAVRENLLTFGLKKNNIITLLDAEATYGNIIEAMSDLRAKTAFPSTAYIYYSGHGYSTGSRSDGTRPEAYIIPADTRFGDTRRMISQREFIDGVMEIAAREKVFVFDSCFSGTSLSVAKGYAKGIPLSYSWQRLADLTHAAQQAREDDLGVVGLFSSKSRRPSYEDDSLRHGAFTYHLLNPPPNVVSIIDAYQHAKDMLAEATNPQVTHLSVEGNTVFNRCAWEEVWLS